MNRRRLSTATILAALSTATPSANAAVASCYGPGLFGNPMANGETLTRSTIGVAHRTLPFGTRLRIRLERRTVVAPVTDRGPFIGGRSLDLTSATAQRLGYSTCTAFGVRSVRSSRA